MDFAVHLRFAYPARDELRDLRTEIEYQNPCVAHGLQRPSVGTVVGGFLDDLDVMDMGLAHAGRGYLDELGFGAHFLN